VLAACGPSARLVQFLTANRAEIARPEVVVRTAVLSSALLVALTLAWCAWSRRSPITVGAGLGVIGFFFFTADIFGSAAVPRIAWFVVLVGLCALAATSAAQRTWVAVTVAVVGVGYIAIAGVGYANWRDNRPGLAAVHTSDAVPAGTLPNVYYFVLDAYARDDVMGALYPDDDPTAFNDTLAALGFNVDSDATANYAQTDQSVPSTLNQVLIIDERTPTDQVLMDRSPILMGDNATVAYFRELGYHYVQTHTQRHDPLQCDQARADACLGPRARSTGISLGEVERSLLEVTPIGPVVLSGDIVDLAEVDVWPTDVVGGLFEDGWLTRDRPIFVYAHILAPHPPYVRDGQCEEIEPFGDLGQGWGPGHEPYYLGHVQCLRTEMSQSLERLIEADPTAIVVVQSDHGPAFDVDLLRPIADWTDEMMRMRFGAFRSWRMPEPCLPEDEAASSLVNTFRVVEACVGAGTPELIDPQSYLIRNGAVEALPPGIIAPAPTATKEVLE
jgi:hypothetical protein